MSFIEKLDFGVEPSVTQVYISLSTGKYIITGDIFLCETLNKKFRKLDPKGTAPSSRAAHATVFVDNVLYIYGGALGGNPYHSN
jgi:hypothetical protein